MAEVFKPIVGKNVIETLTLGMYDDARFIYREYVQNAADQIDIAVEKGLLNNISDGEISIHIDTVNRQISVEDNATGISAEDALRFLGDVANSQKDVSQRKGFRGIGRLGGLGYCEKLVFETSYQGEPTKSIISFDASLLRKIIQDRSDKTDASAVISIITTIEQVAAQKEDHYFKVYLNNVTNDLVLNEDGVKSYLSMVAPLPFDPEFSFFLEIKNWFKDNNFSLDEYIVKLNTQQLFKSYKDAMTDKDSAITNIIGVDFFSVNDDRGNLMALGWFGIRDNINHILDQSVNQRGIRLRKNNIQIGDQFTLNRFFNIERTNFRFVGELHAFDPFLIPNARRDYFNDNTTCQIFEREVKNIFKTENWENKYAQKASQIYNRIKEIEEYKRAVEEFNNTKGQIDSIAKENHLLNTITLLKEKAEKASTAINKIKQNAQKDKNVKKLFEHIVGDKDLALPITEGVFSRNIYDPPSFVKLNEEQAKVVREIIDILFESLPFEEADQLKKKIVDRFN
jgi:hypothetical protein